MTPYSWVTYCQANPAFGRWDQAHIGRILNGQDWVVPGTSYYEIPWNPNSPEGQIIVLPVGHYAEHRCLRSMVPKFRWALEQKEWATVILTSDETNSFPIEDFVDLENVEWWVQLPDPERPYPVGTKFFGEGSPWSPTEIAQVAASDKDIDVFYAGQVNHARRDELISALQQPMMLYADFVVTGGFTQGMERADYYRRMSGTKLAPAPSGVVSHSSFRFYEALEAQAIPIPDAYNPAGQIGYWDRVHPDYPLPPIKDWRNLEQYAKVCGVGVNEPPGQYAYTQSLVSSWWQRTKREMAWNLAASTQSFPYNDLLAGEQITVLIPTSPSPLHPDMSIILETIDSVRSRLPESEIFILIDGVRTEQRHRFDDYYEYVRRLCAWTNTQQNICPIVFQHHTHQASMTHHALETLVESRFVLFVEHDAPLTGDIPFEDIITTMDVEWLNLVRFHHEVSVLPDHAHLFLESEPTEPWDPTIVPFVRTMQWSQRPHLARTEVYKQWITRYFAPEAKTMIEDVMHAITEAQLLHFGEDAWKRWRLALYAPPNGYKRSLHTDGRREDPKYPMTFAYNGDTPLGAPHPGTR